MLIITSSGKHNFFREYLKAGIDSSRHPKMRGESICVAASRILRLKTMPLQYFEYKSPRSDSF